MRGDVLFYTPDRKDLIGHLIARATNGPYCHVAIDLGAGWVEEAVLAGIKRDEYVRVEAARYHPDGNIEKGLAWAGKQLGHKYGLLDIFDQLLRLIFHTTLYIAQPRSYDCSDLVTRYLLHCGMDLGPLADAPHLVTPNDLARQLLHAGS